jgi:hypothetical protein
MGLNNHSKGEGLHYGTIQCEVLWLRRRVWGGGERGEGIYSICISLYV